jgi:uncharacterized protein (DUF2147 family)
LKKEINELSKNNEQTISEIKQIKSELRLTKKELAEKAEYVKTFEEILGNTQEESPDEFVDLFEFPNESEGKTWTTIENKKTDTDKGRK